MKNNMTKISSPLAENSSCPSCLCSIHLLTGLTTCRGRTMSPVLFLDGKVSQDVEQDFEKVYLEAYEVAEVL
jgi:hypothetical protein